MLTIMLILIYFSANVFYNWDKDTTEITTRAFAILATLAAVSFSCARVDLIPNNLKEHVFYGGVCCFLAAILCIIASTIKYALFSLLTVEFLQKERTISFVIRATFGGLAGAVFTFANAAALKGFAFLYEPFLFYYKNKIQPISDPHEFK